MKLLLCGLLALMRAAAADRGPEPVAIFSEFEHDAPPGVMQSLRSELEVIMAPAGFRFSWYSLKSANGRDTYPELVVVTFKGDCTAVVKPLEPQKAGPLGWTHRTGGELLPFIGVDCGKIHNLIGADLISAKPEEREEMLGRAMGRVLAHELYHILAKTANHGSGGVAKAYYSSHELTAESLRLRDRDSERLRTRRPRLFRVPRMQTALR